MKKTHLSKRALSLIMALMMVITSVPIFALPAVTEPIEAQAADFADQDYWQILASTDFTKTEWTASDKKNYYTSASPNTEMGGYKMGWNVKYRDNEDGVNVDSNIGVKFHYNSSSDRDQGFMFLSSYKIGDTKYDSSNYRSLFEGVDNFKVDLAFSYFANTKRATGNNFNGSSNNPLLKLAHEDDTSCYLGWRDRYPYDYEYFTQEVWGERDLGGTTFSGNNDIAATSSISSGGAVAITTATNNNGTKVNPNLSNNEIYHYVVMLSKGYLWSYLADTEGQIIIHYDPIKLSNYSSFSLVPSDITGIVLGASQFSGTGYYDLENVAWKSIEIYKGVNTVDETKDHYLQAYFRDSSARVHTDTADGESLRYAVSSDGVNFEPLNYSMPVWDEDGSVDTDDIAVYPEDSGNFDVTKHIRDPYIFKGQDGYYYVLATDLDTQNGSWTGHTPPVVNNNKLLVWKLRNLEDIDVTTPWAIDTSAIPGMEEVVGVDSYVRKAWAPQAIWDPTVGKYMLYWTCAWYNSSTNTGSNTCVFYSYTSDFKDDFTAPAKLLDNAPCTNFIDADITYYEGLYYLWFKNEDSSGTASKKYYYAYSARPNGPYTEFTTFIPSNGKNVEGPQVYQLADGSFNLLSDEYDDHTFSVYNASTPYGFNSSNPQTTNVAKMLPRHGCVIPITEAEYNALIGKYHLVPSTDVEYHWETEGAGNGGKTDTTGNYYHPEFGTTTANKGVLSITNGAVFMCEDDAKSRPIYEGDEWTVNFKYKPSSVTGSTTVFAIGTLDRDYIRLRDNGALYLGNSEDSSFNSPAISATFVANTTYDITITRHGALIQMLVKGGAYTDETWIGGSTFITEITKAGNGTLYISLGWSDRSGGTKGTGEWGHFTLAPRSTTTGHEGDLVSDLADSLDNLINSYETDMESGIYKNMAPAYAAYVKSCEAMDAYNYGNMPLDDASTAISTAAAEFNAAYNNMISNPWTRYTAPTRNRAFSTDTFDYPAAYTNLLYLQTDYTQTSSRGEYSSTDNYPVRMWYYYPEATMLYDGTTAPTLSIAANMTSTNGSKDRPRYVLTIFLDGVSNAEFGNAYWKGSMGGDYNTTWALTAGTELLNTVNSDSATNYSNSAFTQVKEGSKNAVEKRFANYLKYSGNMSNNTLAYDTITPKLTFYANNSWSWKTNDGLNKTITCNTDIHVINYKRLLDKINSNTYTNVIHNIDDYQQNVSGNTYNMLLAYDAMTAFDIASYFTSSNDWNTCQSDMTTVINGMSGKTATVDNNNYKTLKAAFDTCKNSGLGTFSEMNAKQLFASDQVKANTVENYAAFVTAYNAAATHMAGLIANHYNYESTSTVEANLRAAIADLSLVDQTNYITAVAKANAAIDNVAKYSDLARNTMQDTTLPAYETAYDGAVGQTGVDAVAAAIITAINEMALRPYNMIFNVYENDVLNETLSYSTTELYGDNHEFAYTGDLAVYRWTATLDNTSREYRINSTALNTVAGAYADGIYTTTYNVYCTSGSSSGGESSSKVTMLTQNAHTADVQYITNGDYTVTFEKDANSKLTGTITLTGAGGTYSLTTTQSEFLEVTSFKNYDTNIPIVDGSLITIDGELRIRPSMAGVGTMQITFANGCKKVSDGTSGTQATKWDEKIIATKDGADNNTAWYLNDVLIGYGAQTKFRVCQGCTLRPENGSEAPVANFIYSTYGEYRENAISLVGHYYVPTGATFKETGIIILRDNDKNHAAFTASQLYNSSTNEPASGARKMVAKNLTDSNQFLYNLNNSSGGEFSLGVVMYLKYNDGSDKYIYSNPITINSDNRVL